MARRNLPKGRAGRHGKKAPRFDMDSYFERGYKARVSKGLYSNEATRKSLVPIEAEQDRRKLVLLLCNVVFRRTQQNIKTDAALEAIGGSKADNIENAPRRIKTFCKWLSNQVKANYDLRNDNTAEDVIPKLMQIAETLSLAPPTARKMVRYWNRLYIGALDSLARFMEGKTGRPHYADMAKLLEESARTLGKSQAYDAHTILVRLRAHRGQ